MVAGGGACCLLDGLVGGGGSTAAADCALTPQVRWGWGDVAVMQVVADLLISTMPPIKNWVYLIKIAPYKQY